MHILSPDTDNCPSWISGRKRMTIENFHDQPLKLAYIIKDLHIKIIGFKKYSIWLMWSLVKEPLCVSLSVKIMHHANIAFWFRWNQSQKIISNFATWPKFHTSNFLTKMMQNRAYLDQTVLLSKTCQTVRQIMQTLIRCSILGTGIVKEEYSVIILG